MKSKNDENVFFQELINKTKKIYLKSDVFKSYSDKEWYYAICDSSIKRNRPVLFGLNWGGKNHNPQSKMPENYERKFPLAKHANKYMGKYLSLNIDEINYTNLCFFRTPSTKYLTNEDWNISFPLFEEFIEFVNPPVCIMLGKPNSILKRNIREYRKITYKKSKERRAFAYVGLLFGKYPFCSLPHSRSSVTNHGREYLWSEAVKVLKNEYKIK